MKRRDESRKTVRKNFRYIECDAFAEYLHDMSLRGWHFCGWTGGLVFEKGEAEDICYCVEVFPGGSEMDTAPGPDALDYAEYCRAAGWELIDGQGCFCIFRRIDENAAPIVTEEERLENIFRAERNALFLELTSRSFLTFVFWGKLLGDQFEDWVFSDARLLLLLFSTAVTAYRLCKTAALYVLWNQYRRRAEAGVPVHYGRRDAARRAESVIGVLALGGAAGYACLSKEWIILPLLAAMLLLLTGIDYYIGRIRPKRKENWALQIGAGGISVLVMLVVAAAVFSIPGAVPGQETDIDAQASDAPDLSLRPEDYREVYGEPVSSRLSSEKSVLGSRASVRISYGTEEEEDTDGIIYFVCRSECPWVIERFWNINTRGEYPEVHCEDAWDAREAWGVGRYAKKNYYVRYDDVVFIIYGEDLSEQKAVDAIREKLNLP